MLNLQSTVSIIKSNQHPNLQSIILNFSQPFPSINFNIIAGAVLKIAGGLKKDAGGVEPVMVPKNDSLLP
jgi:hypothetical protein